MWNSRQECGMNTNALKHPPPSSLSLKNPSAAELLVPVELAYILIQESPLVFNTKLLSFLTIFELLEFNAKFHPFHIVAWKKTTLYRLS